MPIYSRLESFWAGFGPFRAMHGHLKRFLSRRLSHTQFFLIDIDLSSKIGFRRKIFSCPKKFSQNCPKVNFQWFSAKTKFRPRFRFFKKSWIFDEKFLKIQKSTKFALKLISIGIEQFRAIFGSIKPLRVINNRSELLNAVLKHLKPFKDILEPFRVL